MTPAAATPAIAAAARARGTDGRAPPRRSAPTLFRKFPIHTSRRSRFRTPRTRPRRRPSTPAKRPPTAFSSPLSTPIQERPRFGSRPVTRRSTRMSRYVAPGSTLGGRFRRRDTSLRCAPFPKTAIWVRGRSLTWISSAVTDVATSMAGSSPNVWLSLFAPANSSTGDRSGALTAYLPAFRRAELEPDLPPLDREPEPPLSWTSSAPSSTVPSTTSPVCSPASAAP